MTANTSSPLPLSALEQLDSLVFISNAVPKSGSTILYNIQSSFLRTVAGKGPQNLDDFALAGVTPEGFVRNPHNENFIEKICSKEIYGGPYIFKTHTMINGALRDAFVNSGNVFASMTVRDPAEIFFSAGDNFRKTGEFPEFSDEDSGIEMIQNFFAKMLRSVEATSKLKTIPVVRYEMVTDSLFDALISSFSPDLSRLVLKAVAESNSDLKTALFRSEHRRNLAGNRRPEAEALTEAWVRIAEKLQDVRTMFGYPSK
ncbi:hypothetical protein GC209_13455 [bacterium]|nr:hypothetical protein [bacterium]